MDLSPNTPVSFMSLDFGNLYSPDGREHQLTALMPLSITTFSDANSTDPTQQGQGGYPSPAAAAAASGTGFDITSWLSSHMPSHIGARVVLAVIGVILIAVVAFRLVK